MVRKKDPVWQFFKDNIKGGAVCKYCNTEYKFANVAKMTKHIKKCFKCPQEIKKTVNLKLNTSTVPTKKMGLSMMTTSTPNTSTTTDPQYDNELELDVSFDPEGEGVIQGQMSSNSQALSLASCSSNASSISGKSDHSIFNQPRPRHLPSPAISENSRGGMLNFLDHMDNQLNVSKSINYL